MINPIEKISSYAASVTRVLIIALASMLVIILLVGIFYRYVVGSALSWPDEMAIVLVPWLILLAGSLGVREGFHVRLTVLATRLPLGVQKVLVKMVLLAIAMFGCTLFYSGYDLVIRTAGNVTPSLRLPLELINYSAPVCGALITIHCLANLFGSKEN